MRTTTISACPATIVVKGRAALTLLFALTSVGSVAAQGVRLEEGREVTVLSLRDALSRAAEHNPQYRQALNRMDLVGPAEREALGAFLPSLSVSYGTGQSFRRERTAVDFFGNIIENQDGGIATSSRANQGVSASVDLFRGGSRFHAVGQARAQARVDRRTAERELNTILAEVERQFLVAQRQKAGLGVEMELLTARERDVEAARARFELVAIGRSDLLATELELETQRVAVTRARGDHDKGLLALRRAIGDPSLVALDVAQQLPDPFDPADLDIGGLVERAMEESPRIRAAEAALAVRQSALSSQRARRWPTLSLSSNFGRSSFGDERSKLFDVNPSDFAGSVSLSVSIPIFTKFETTRAIAAADVELRNANETIRQAENEVEEQIRVRFVDLETAWASVRERARRLEIATERLDIVREEYRLATKSIEDLRAAVREEASALRDVVDQRFEFAVALVGLYEAAGIVGREAGLEAEPEGN